MVDTPGFEEVVGGVSENSGPPSEVRVSGMP